MRRILNVIHSFGLITVIFSFTLLFPFLMSLYFKDGVDRQFLYSFVGALGIGFILALVTIPFRQELRLRDGMLLVSLVWTLFPVIAAMPMYLSKEHIDAGFSFTHAYYEAMSGLTTTGSSVIAKVSQLPPSINLWRCSLIWFGGMGILLLAVAILPLLGVGGHQVMRGEMPGPLKEEKLTPRIASTAKALYSIYFMMSLLCFIAFRIAGLDWFSAWCQAASTMALGGFSIYDDGFADIGSVWVDLVAIFFMLFASINFATHFRAFQRRSLRDYLSCPETVPFLIIVLGSALVISSYLYFSGVYPSVLSAFRFGFFNTVSVATTTGFANDDYSTWPIVVCVWMMFLSSFTTSAGSTGGGVKLIRVILIVKQIKAEIKRIMHPHGVFPVRLGSRLVDSSVMMSVMVFILMYLLSLTVLTITMLATGLDPVTSFTVILASLANMGSGMGLVGPMSNYGVLSDTQLWICTFTMLIGRLELFTVLVIFMPGFWRA